MLSLCFPITFSENKDDYIQRWLKDCSSGLIEPLSGDLIGEDWESPSKKIYSRIGKVMLIEFI